MGWDIFLEKTFDYAWRIPMTVLYVCLGWLVLRGVRVVVTKSLQQLKVDHTVISLIQGIVTFAGVTALCAILLSTLGLNELALAVSGSIALIAMSIATSASNVTRDLIAGLYLLADEDFSVGSTLRVGSIEGRIIQLSVRKTKLIDDGGHIHILPNRNIDDVNYMLLKDTR